MELDEVYEGIRNDERWEYLRFPGIALVPGRGNSVDPLAMIVGTAPSAQDNLKRSPFAGQLGPILSQLMTLAGLSVEWRGKQTGFKVPAGCPEGVPPNVFVTNLVKYRLPGSRNPSGLEISGATEALREEWKAIGRPRLIVTLGVAAYAFVRTDKEIPDIGDWQALKDGKTFVWFQHHPASGLRQDDKFRERMERQWEGMGSWIQSNL